MKRKLFVFATVLSIYMLFVIGFSLADSRGHIAGVLDQAGLVSANYTDTTPGFLDPTPVPLRPDIQQVDPTPEPPRTVINRVDPTPLPPRPVINRIDPTPLPPRP
jgi:hypothetical protein